MSDLDVKTVSRFWTKVNRSGPIPPGMKTPCWIWTRFTHKGYGRFGLGGHRAVRAHRFAWMLLRGPIPPGLELDHLCRVRRCVNPSHIEPVSTRVNILRGVGPSAANARKTRCAAGHPLPIGRGRRRCLACRRPLDRARKAKARARGPC